MRVEGSSAGGCDFRCLKANAERCRGKTNPQRRAKELSAHSVGSICPASEAWAEQPLRNPSGWLLALSMSFTVNPSPAIRERSRGEGPEPELAHTTARPRHRQTPAELLGVYVGTAGAGACTETSQDQWDSSAGKPQPAPLPYPAAVSTARVCRDLRAWKQTCACLNQTRGRALSKNVADVKSLSQCPSHKSRDQKFVSHQLQEEISEAQKTGAPLAQIFPQELGSWLSLVPHGHCSLMGTGAEPSTRGTPGAQGCESDGFTATRLERQILQEVGQGLLKRNISPSTHNRGIHSRFSLRAKATSGFCFFPFLREVGQTGHQQMQGTLTQQLARASFSLSPSFGSILWCFISRKSGIYGAPCQQTALRLIGKCLGSVGVISAK